MAISIIAFVATPTRVAAQELSALAARVFESTVMITVDDHNGQPLALASGFVVAENIIVTNLHVIEDGARARVKLVGEEKFVPVAGSVGISERNDLVLLSVPQLSARVMQLSDTDSTSIGDRVYVVGNPRGLEGTFSEGIVSAIRSFGDDSLVQITAPISPGSSGGPVVDKDGLVIGVAAASMSEGQNLNFAIPASAVLDLLSNKTDLTPLEATPIPQDGRSVFSDLSGSDIRDAVDARQFRWMYSSLQNGKFSITIRNKTDQTVLDVVCLVIAYDEEGVPLDVVIVSEREILPRLARRSEGDFHSSVQEITTRRNSQTPHTKIEFRILDFKIEE